MSSCVGSNAGANSGVRLITTRCFTGFSFGRRLALEDGLGWWLVWLPGLAAVAILIAVSTDGLAAALAHDLLRQLLFLRLLLDGRQLWLQIFDFIWNDVVHFFHLFSQIKKLKWRGG